MASYSSVLMNMSFVPFQIRLGLCLPKECNQDQFDKAIKYSEKMLNMQYQMLYNMTGLETPITTNGT